MKFLARVLYWVFATVFLVLTWWIVLIDALIKHVKEWWRIAKQYDPVNSMKANGNDISKDESEEETQVNEESSEWIFYDLGV